MNAFDARVLMLFNRAAQRCPALDMAVEAVSENRLLKGGLAMAVVWGLWFSACRQPDAMVPGGRAARQRRRILAILGAAFLALALARGLGVSLPYRPRPLTLAGFWTPTAGAAHDATDFMHRESAFPSDHASLYFALATGILMVSRRAGWAALAYVTVVIALPRIYLGKHYPTDVLAGAAIGVSSALLAVCLVERAPPLRRVGAWLVRQSWQAPVPFYGAFFLLTFSIAEHFESVRTVAHVRVALAALLRRFG